MSLFRDRKALDGVLDAFVFLSYAPLPSFVVVPCGSLYLLERMRTIGRAPDTSAWMEKGVGYRVRFGN